MKGWNLCHHISSPISTTPQKMAGKQEMMTKHKKLVNPFRVSRAIRGINASFPYGDTHTVSSSLGFGPPLFVKVKVFTLKNNAPCGVLLPRSPESLLQKKRRRVERKKKIFLNTKCCYYSCGVLKYTPRRPVVCSLVGTQLESTPFSACWTKWHLVEAAERRWGDTGIQVLNAKLPVAAKHADANTQRKCVCVLEFVNTSTSHTHAKSFNGVSKKDLWRTSIKTRPV